MADLRLGETCMHGMVPRSCGLCRSPPPAPPSVEAAPKEEEMPGWGGYRVAPQDPNDWSNYQTLLAPDGAEVCTLTEPEDRNFYRDLKSLVARLAASEQARQQAEERARRLGIHLSHCNFGEHVGACKYGDEDCPALTEAWSWFGQRLARAEQAEERARALEADMAAAAGELLVPIPEAGTDAARLLSANVLLRRERAEIQATLNQARESYVNARTRAEQAEREAEDARLALRARLNETPLLTEYQARIRDLERSASEARGALGEVLVQAAGLLARRDFWGAVQREGIILPGEYDDLSEATARARAVAQKGERP